MIMFPVFYTFSPQKISKSVKQTKKRNKADTTKKAEAGTVWY